MSKCRRKLAKWVIVAALVMIIAYIWKDKGLIWFVDILLGTLHPWAATLLIALTCLVYGDPVVSRIFRWDASRPAYNYIRIAVGAAILTSIMWILGWLGLFYAPVLACLVIPVFFSYRQLKRCLLSQNDTSDAVRKSTFNNHLMILFWSYIGYTALQSTMPSIGHDPISTLLYAPAEYLKHHEVAFHPWFAFQQVQGMLVALQMTLVMSNEPTSTLSFLFMVLTAGMVGLLAEKLWEQMPLPFGERGAAGTLAALLYVLMPMSRITSFQSLNEHYMVFFIVCMVYAMVEWNETKNDRWLIVAGICGGASCGVDFNGIIPTLICIVIAWRRFWKILIPGLIAAAPWYLPSVIHFGNPLFPFYEEWFGWAAWGTHEAISTHMTESHRMLTVVLPEGSGIMDALTGLFTGIFYEELPWCHGQVGRVGVLLWAATLFIPVLRWYKPIQIPAAFVLLSYAYWVFYEHIYHARFMMYVFAIHGVIAAVAVRRAILAYRLNRRVILAVLILFAVTMSIPAAYPYFHTSQRARHKYLYQNKPGIPSIMTLSGMNIECKAYMLDLQGYRLYCDFDIAGDEWGENSYAEFEEHARHPRELYDWLESIGCNFLVANTEYFTEMEKDPRGSGVWAKYFAKLENATIVHAYWLIPRDIIEGRESQRSEP